MAIHCKKVCIKVHCMMECWDMTTQKCRHVPLEPWREKLDKYENNQEEEREMTNTSWSEQVCEEVHSREKYKHMPMKYWVDKVDEMGCVDNCHDLLYQRWTGPAGGATHSPHWARPSGS